MKIDGRMLARSIYSHLQDEVNTLKKKGIQPHLVVILVGNDPGSKAYIRQKMNRGVEVGILVTLKRFPRHTTEKTILTFVKKQNSDPTVHGIIIQRPLPSHISSETLKSAVIPSKDVDGFHHESQYEPPLALAIMQILEEMYRHDRNSSVNHEDVIPWLKNKKIVFMGRGEAGGKPVISYFVKYAIPYMVIHSQTVNPKDILKNAEIVISAVGKDRIITSDKLKNNVILVGIGLHTGDHGKLRGDYDENEIAEKAKFYTPTPGGVGPLNVAMLLSNVIHAAKKIKL